MENSKLLIVVSAIAVIIGVTIAMVVMSHNGKNEATPTVPAKPAASIAASMPSVVGTATASDTVAELVKQREALDAKIKQAEAQTNALNTAVETSKNYVVEQTSNFFRAQAYAKGVKVAQSFRVAATQHYLEEGRWPASNKAMGMPEPSSFAGGNLRSVGIDGSGRISVVFAAGEGKTETIIQQGADNPSGFMAWKCFSHDIKEIAAILPNCVYEAK